MRQRAKFSAERVEMRNKKQQESLKNQEVENAK